MVNYVDLWLVHSHVASLLDGARLELREVKPHSTLLGACTTYPSLRSDLEDAVIEIKDLKHKFDHSSRYTVLSPPCEVCVSLKGKLFHATKENIELQHEVAYLTVHLEKTILSEKMIEGIWAGLRWVQPNPHTDWMLVLRGVRISVRRVLRSSFLAPPTTKRREPSNPQKLTTHPIISHPLTPREAWRKKPPSREMKPLFAYFVAVLVT
jgi:hypothetical protein